MLELLEGLCRVTVTSTSTLPPFRCPVEQDNYNMNNAGSGLVDLFYNSMSLHSSDVLTAWQSCKDAFLYFGVFHNLAAILHCYLHLTCVHAAVQGPSTAILFNKQAEQAAKQIATLTERRHMQAELGWHPAA